ncbi:YitT family protein [Nocardiopsis sp. NPDC057823]|uniref:membrane protein YczE n=1 Tax=Nocardiopsis sp. NPDC057823 TaxID=3346256 RepID=UPI00366DFBF0
MSSLPLRYTALTAGLALFGLGVALMVRADLGMSSWDVLHQGLAHRTGLPLGGVVIGVGALVLLLWLPLRQRPGPGTVANVLLVGPAVEVSLALLPDPQSLLWRWALLAAGVVLTAAATALYVGAGLGPGPRDGLMTGLAARGLSIARARTAIELSVLVLGWLFGGSVGVGTVLFALAVGPLTQAFLSVLRTGAPLPAPAPAHSPSKN